MESGEHKGTELNNVKETWDQNEKNLQNDPSGSTTPTPPEIPATTELEQIIKDEAREYDNDNKEDRTLGGERATVNDD